MINKKVLIVVIITFITILTWAILDILHSRSEVHIPEDTEQLLTPIDPTFDQETINEL